MTGQLILKAPVKHFFADSLYCMLFSWVHVGTQCVKKLNRSVFGEVVLTSE